MRVVFLKCIPDDWTLLFISPDAQHLYDEYVLLGSALPKLFLYLTAQPALNVELLPTAYVVRGKVMFSVCPHLGGRGYPGQVQWEGTPPLVPPCCTWWGVPLVGGGTPPRVPPHQTWLGGYPWQGVPHLRWSTWYAAVGMPLAFTQEDFLVCTMQGERSHTFQLRWWNLTTENSFWSVQLQNSCAKIFLTETNQSFNAMNLDDPARYVLWVKFFWSSIPWYQIMTQQESHVVLTKLGPH